LDVPEEVILENLTKAATYILAAVLILYFADYLSLRFQIPNHRTQFGSVQVRRYYAVPQKDRSTEFMFEQPKPQTCVYSIFPHLGDSPCWYLNRHKSQQINVGGMPASPY
jgi:hypothetical protein